METPFAAYTGDQPYVFVCYAHDDSDVVYPEMAWLRDQGLNLWYDEGISAGKNWRTAIGDSILNASHVLFYVSVRSLKSDHCNREINLALDEGKEVVPVYIEDVELTTDLKVGLNRVQALHREQSANYERHLLSALGKSSTAIDPQPRVPAKDARNPLPARTALVLALALLVVAGWWFWPKANYGEIPAAARNEPVNTAVELTAKAIAVLPFTNMTNDPEQEFFSDGIAEDILNELAKNRALTVRPRSSSFALKGVDLDLKSIGQRLNVTHVLGGSVRRSGERIRITVQLSEVGSDRSVWSERYDRELTDIFVVQDSVVEEVLSALSIQFGGYGTSRYAPKIEAYEAFLRGRDYVLRFDAEAAEQWLKKAVDLDPSFADAWAYRGQNLALVAATGFSPNLGESALRRREYTITALELEPSNANALATHALMDTFYRERDYESAVNELIRLVRLNPNNESAQFYLSIMFKTIGRIDLFSKVGHRLVGLSPESMRAQLTRVGALIRTETYEPARVALQEFDARFEYPLLGIGLAGATGDIPEFEQRVERAATRGFSTGPIYPALVPYFKGDFERAREMISPIHSAKTYQSHYVLSLAALVERDLDAAFDQYYEGVEAAEPGAIQSIQGRAEFRRAFPEFFADPRYFQMLRYFGLDKESVEKMQIDELPF